MQSGNRKQPRLTLHTGTDDGLVDRAAWAGLAPADHRWRYENRRQSVLVVLSRRCALVVHSSGLRPCAGPLPRPRTSRAGPRCAPGRHAPCFGSPLRGAAWPLPAPAGPTLHGTGRRALRLRRCRARRAVTLPLTRAAQARAYGSAVAPCPSTPSRLRRAAPGRRAPLRAASR